MQPSKSGPERPSGILYRLIQSLTFVLVLACLICGYLGLRAIVWQHEAELESMLTSGLLIAAAIGLVVGALYVVFGARSLRLLAQFHWMNVQLGLVFGMILYGLYNTVLPMPTYARIELALRALQGAVDGALIGAFVGGLVGIVGGRSVHLTLNGIGRYSVLFLIVLLVITLSVQIANRPGVPRNFAVWLLIPLLIVLRLIINLYDRWQNARHMANHETPPGHYEG